MNPEDWNQIKQVFSAALGAPAGGARCVPAQPGRRRPGLRRAVDELLRAHYGASQHFLEPGSVVLSAPWLFRDGDSVAGRFKVIRRIARGAMGEVYQVYDERLRLHGRAQGDPAGTDRRRRHGRAVPARSAGHPRHRP